MNTDKSDLQKNPVELLKGFEQDLVWYQNRDFSNLTKADANLFLEALQDRNKNVRAGAMLVLGYLEEPRAIPFLLEALKDKYFGLRICAAYALGDLRATEAVPALLGILDDHIYKQFEQLNGRRLNKNRQISYIVIYSLGKIASDRATSALLDLLQNSQDAWVRLYAAGALGDIKDPVAFEPLIEALGDEDSEADTIIAKALVNYRDERAIPALIKALGNHNNRPSNDPHAVNELGVVVAQLGEAVVEPLIEALKDEKKRWLAARALGRTGDARAIAPLSVMYNDKTIDHDTLDQVTRALILLKNEEISRPWET